MIILNNHKEISLASREKVLNLWIFFEKMFILCILIVLVTVQLQWIKLSKSHNASILYYIIILFFFHEHYVYLLYKKGGAKSLPESIKTNVIFQESKQVNWRHDRIQQKMLKAFAESNKELKIIIAVCASCEPISATRKNVFNSDFILSIKNY